MIKGNLEDLFRFPVMIRRLLLSWLSAATASYFALSQPLKQLSSLDGIRQMSFVAMVVMTLIFFIALTVIGCYRKHHRYERCLLFGIFSILATITLIFNFTWQFFFGNLLLVAILLVYALKGWNASVSTIYTNKKERTLYKVILWALAAAFIIFVSVWTVCRVVSFCTPTYDFGIFSQMFYNMKSSGIPYTTVERDVLLSHFQVHVSPIYYLLLPIYFLFPYPATLQILQACVLGSSIIPLWLLCRKHGLSPIVSIILCAILLIYPSYSGGTSYDIHENAFLTPLLLWLFYGIDTRNIPVTITAASLTLLVKEDAAVYVAVVALYLLVRSSLHKHNPNRKWGVIFGLVLLVGSIAWFMIVTGYLASQGDGVMTYRYQNFMADGSGSLVSVIKTVLLCPQKALYECLDPEKLEFIIQTLVPLLFLPFITRKYQRYILLIPYLLINLMSDYQYQHDIFFQYTFGSTACLMYLTVVNIADWKQPVKQTITASISLVLCCLLFIQCVVPVASRYARLVKNNGENYQKIRQTLSQIPDGATVAATTFYTTQLSQREVLYDVKYTSQDNLLSAEYVALAIHSETNYRKYETEEASGYENLVKLLEDNGYEIFAQLDNTLVIYKR